MYIGNIFKLAFFFLLMACSLQISAQENCINGIDDDGDGLIDLQDPDCACTGIQPWEDVDILANPMFNEQLCCPPSFSQMDCLKDWHKGTTATSDYMDTCDFIMPAVIAAGLVPFPSNPGAVGIIISDSWSEYVATCPSTKLDAGRAYRLTIQIASLPVTNFGDVCNDGIITFPDIDFAIWGNPNCVVPVATDGCPSLADSTWNILGTSLYHPESKWESLSITFVPSVDINGLMLGASCDLPGTGYSGSPCYPYFVLDNVFLETADAIESIDISDNGWTVKEDYSLTAEVNVTGGTWQWYYEGIAIQGQVAAEFYFHENNYQPGHYQVVYTKDGKCIQESFYIALPPPVAKVDIIDIVNDTFYFDNRSKDALEYIWHFGDGTTSSEEDPLFHQYPGQGYYDGFLVAINHCCSDTFYFTAPIFQPPFLLDSFLAPHSCDSLGTIILDILSSTPFTCEWSNGEISDEPTICDLLPGQYTVVVTNQNGQSSFGPFTIDSTTIGFQGTVNVETVPTCTTPPTGVIMLVSSDSNANYLYQWSHDPTLTSSMAENLPSGDYQVTLTDTYGCQKVISINLPDQGPIIESLVVGSPLCPGEQSGTLDVLISGPNNPFTVEVLNLFTSMLKVPPYQLDRGDYRIDILDANGCFTTREFKVIDPPAMQIEFLIGLDGDGQPTILIPKVSQGKPPYSFLWSDGSTDPSRSDLKPGTYQVTVTDGEGCSQAKEIKYGIPGGGVIGNGGLQVEQIPGTAMVRFDRVDNTPLVWNIRVTDVHGRVTESLTLMADQHSHTSTLPFPGLYWIQATRSDGFQIIRSFVSY